MSHATVKELLCSLSLADRIARCDELLLTDLIADDRMDVLYFKGHALYELNRLAEALVVFDVGLAVPATDAELRANCLSGKAMTLYDLGRLDEMGTVLQDMGLLPLPDTAKGLSLKGSRQMLHGLYEDAAVCASGYGRFIEAAAFYERAEEQLGFDWALLNAALSAIQAGMLSEAAACARQVSNESMAPLARLYEAQVLYRGGELERSQQLIDQVLAGKHGAVANSHFSRAKYLAGLKAYDAGDLFAASVLLSEALDYLALEPRKELDLRRDIHSLRARIARGRDVA